MIAVIIILHRQFFHKDIQCSGTSVKTWTFHAVIMRSKIHNTVEEWKVTVACLKGITKFQRHHKKLRSMWQLLIDLFMHKYNPDILPRWRCMWMKLPSFLVNCIDLFIRPFSLKQHFCGKLNFEGFYQIWGDSPFT